MDFKKLYAFAFYIYAIGCLIVFCLIVLYSILYIKGEIKKGRNINVIAALIFLANTVFHITYLILYYLNN